MTTTTAPSSHGTPRRPAALPPFRTPVRGHAFAPRHPGTSPPVPGEIASLVPEPANPADPHAVAVWVGEGDRRWRIGYLDRDVAARVAPRLREGLALEARVDGWTREPHGRWQRPVVLLRAERSSPAAEPRGRVQIDAGLLNRREAAPAPSGGGVWGRPPGVARRTLGPDRPRTRRPAG